ncbi:MAG: hypothetical protein IJA81_09090 [Akkermansia sp.]|nr:hypothetical protein [Akkermansia sp.]
MITLPISELSYYLLESRLPMGTVLLPACEGSVQCTNGVSTRYGEHPARRVPVILPLWAAHAYPEEYYQNAPAQPEQAEIPNLMESAKDEFRGTK